MEGRFGGKLTFVTGAGQGIGRAVALAFAREGADGDDAASRRLAKLEDLPTIAPGIAPVQLDVTASDDAAFTTGTVAVVDGGQTL